MRQPRRVAQVVAVALLSACHPAGPLERRDLTPLPEPARALELAREAGRARRNLRALGRVTYFGAEGRVRLRAVLVAERPDRFRFETLSPLEQPIDVMTCNGSRLYLLSKEKLAIGPATPENIARLLPLPMHPEEVVDTLLGGAPTSARFEPTAIAWEEPDLRRWVLTLTGVAGDTARLFIDPVRKVVVAMQLLEPGGQVRLRVDFADFEDAGSEAGELPRTIAIAMPARDLEVDIKLREVDVNVPLDAGLFQIEPPPGVVPERLDSPPAAVYGRPHRGAPSAAPTEPTPAGSPAL